MIRHPDRLMKTALQLMFLACITVAPIVASAEDKDPIVGRWKNVRSGCVMILSADGKAHEYKTNFSMNGKWECIDEKGITRKYRVNWEHGLHVYEWHLSTGGDKILGKDGKIASHRIKE